MKSYPKIQNLGSILVVENSFMIAKTLCKGLMKLGYTVEHASTLKDALFYLEAHTFNLIVLDLNLPDGDGEVIIDPISNHKTAKIIVYTGDIDKEQRNELFRYGVLSYLSKSDPFSYVLSQIHKTMLSLMEDTFYNILIVDDSPFICNCITALLQPRNYKIFTANNGTLAKQKLLHVTFDLIILNLELPDIHGEHLLKLIRKTMPCSEVPVFILTGSYNPAMLSTLIKLGANEFFTKPFVAEELLFKIDFWIDFRRSIKENKKQEKILKEYKEIVDRSTLVSKADKNGYITYVNDAFCAISGYTREELIGQKHSIVRHPDTPSIFFQELWQTITSGLPWQGMIKNRKKDGSDYWVNAVVSPIIGINDEICEYISIRSDITYIQEVRETLKNELKITENNFQDAYHLSQQYVNAINESSIVTRTNLEGDIIYANQYFYDTTGYCEEEIIGKKHSIIKHKDTPRTVFDELWQTIQMGNTWKGILKNRKKDGSAYWVASTILPIKDKQENIVEYMSIRHEITEIMHLQEEIEKTQQEIVYKMGEIGESRNEETGNHVRRVAEYSKLLALKSGLDKKEATIIAHASTMHDIGKVGIPDRILLKPSSLDEEEWNTMKTHSMLGYTVLSTSERPLLKAAALIAKEHHERWNGTGYPEGLKEQDIHPYARIVAIADVFDALSHTRPYKKEWSDEAIVNLFIQERGKHFDPYLVDIFLKNLTGFIGIRTALN
jgi:PAS domain S-box-containing protein